MNLEERRQALLRLVTDYRDGECRRILETARRQAAEILAQGYARGRARLHRQVLAERSRARARILAARAEQATRARLAEERRKFALLESAWPLVQDRLLAEWQRPPSRRRWTLTYLHRALELLPQGRWTVRHAPEWSDAERAEVLAELPQVARQQPSFGRDPDMRAGLVVRGLGAVLDASLPGLLADRDRLEARLLALVAVEAAREPRAGDREP